MQQKQQQQEEEEEEEEAPVAEAGGLKLHLSSSGSTGYKGVFQHHSGRFQAKHREPAGPLPPAPEISPLLPPDDLVAGEGGAAAADAVSGGESEAEAGVGLNHLSRSTIVTFFCE